jgi:hypothetical protein
MPSLPSKALHLAAERPRVLIVGWFVPFVGSLRSYWRARVSVVMVSEVDLRNPRGSKLDQAADRFRFVRNPRNPTNKLAMPRLIRDREEGSGTALGVLTTKLSNVWVVTQQYCKIPIHTKNSRQSENMSRSALNWLICFRRSYRRSGRLLRPKTLRNSTSSSTSGASNASGVMVPAVALSAGITADLVTVMALVTAPVRSLLVSWSV